MDLNRLMSILAPTTIFFMGLTLALHKRIDFGKNHEYQHTKWFNTIRIWSGELWLVSMFLTFFVIFLYKLAEAG